MKFTIVFLIIICFGCQVSEKEYVIKNQKELEQFGELNIDTINGSLLIYDVNDLSPLKSIKKISGELKIGYRDSEFDRYRGNTKLKSLIGLNNLREIGGHLVIERTSIENLIGLENLVNIEKGLKIKYNDSLINLKGLNNLSFFTQHIVLSNNPNLISLDGLGNLTEIKSLYIFQNSSLNTLKGFDNLKSIKGGFLLDRNSSLKSLENLKKLETIDGYCKILGNNLLTSMQGLENLKSIGGDLGIKYNESLESLHGLNNLITVGGDLEIGFQEALSRGTFDYGNKKLKDYCSIKNLQILSEFHIENNLYNPTSEQLKTDNNCRQ